MKKLLIIAMLALRIDPVNAQNLMSSKVPKVVRETLTKEYAYAKNVKWASKVNI